MTAKAPSAKTAPAKTTPTKATKRTPATKAASSTKKADAPVKKTVKRATVAPAASTAAAKKAAPSTKKVAAPVAKKAPAAKKAPTKATTATGTAAPSTKKPRNPLTNEPAAAKKPAPTAGTKATKQPDPSRKPDPIKVTKSDPTPPPTSAEATDVPADRSRDDWNDLNRELFIERNRIRAELAELEKILPEDRTPTIKRQIHRARRDFDDVTFKIIDSNYGLLRRYVRKFTQNATRDDAKDFESAAVVGLMRAIETYDPSRGRFANWAFKPIQREVLRAVHSSDHPNMNAGDFERRPDILNAVKVLQNGDESFRPAIEDVAKQAGVTLEQAKRVLHAPRLDSLATPVGDGTSTVEDLVEDQEYSLEDKVIGAMAIKDIEGYGLSQLDARELFVIIRRMGLDREPKQRLSAIGETLGLSREAVRQIESKARGKLVHPVVLRKLVREGRA